LPARLVRLRGSDGREIHARIAETGRGRPVVFLHGLVGLNEHWEEVVRRVRHRLRCVLLELPLLSLSGEDCSIQGVEALTAQFLSAHLAGGRAVLVGNSFGGHVALRTAMNRPDLVGGLVLAGSSGLLERSLVSDIQLRPSREWLVRKIGELFYDPARHLRWTDVERAHRELSTRSGARAMVRLSRTARRDDLRSRMRSVGAPAVLIWGKNDVVTPPEAAEEFLSLLPGARLAWLDECGHAPMIEKPDEFAAAMLDFAEELDRRGGRAGG
jgi:pimeloyl-ACP methyl ester carboxylesterase